MAYLEEDELELLRRLLQQQGQSPKLNIDPIAGMPVTYEIEEAMKNLTEQFPESRESWWNNVLSAAGPYADVLRQYPDIQGQIQERDVGAKELLYTRHLQPMVDWMMENLGPTQEGRPPLYPKWVDKINEYYDSLKAGSPISGAELMQPIEQDYISRYGADWRQYGGLWPSLIDQVTSLADQTTTDYQSYTGLESTMQEQERSLAEQFATQKAALQSREEEISSKWQELKPKFEQARHFGPRQFFKPKEATLVPRGGVAPTEPRGGFLKRFMTQRSMPGMFTSMLPRQRAAGSLLTKYLK